MNKQGAWEQVPRCQWNGSAGLDATYSMHIFHIFTNNDAVRFVEPFT